MGWVCPADHGHCHGFVSSGSGDWAIATLSKNFPQSHLSKQCGFDGNLLINDDYLGLIKWLQSNKVLS